MLELAYYPGVVVDMKLEILVIWNTENNSKELAL